MALNTCKMWSNGIKIVFFSKNLQKSPSGWGLRPQTPIATGGCDTFEYTRLLNTAPKLHICTFWLSISALYLYQSSGLVPTSYGIKFSILR